MRDRISLVLSVGLTLVLGACGGDDGGGTGGAGATGGSGGGGGNGAVATVSGVVLVAAMEGDGTPLEGATVAVLSTMESTQTGPDGTYSLEVPVGTAMLEASALGHWGVLVTEEVPAGGLSDFDIEVIPDELLDLVVMSLGETADPAKGIVAVSFNEDMAVGGERASTVPPGEYSFVFDGLGDPVLSDTLIAGGDAEVIFVNVDPSASVSVTATDSGDRDCPVDFSGAVYPVREKVVTEIEVVCPMP
jgi:hypothetical protein